MESDKRIKIVYMGTPGFAVEPLRSLINNGFNVVAVVTAPDRPAGRGQELKCSDIKLFAVQNNIPVLQPEKLKNEIFLAQLKSLDADLFVVVAFRMLPEVVWNMAPKGTINLHASLLPQYRGAAPINHAIINGETKTGATTFFITHEIDTGEILLQREVEIGLEENAGELHDKLMYCGAELLTETAKQIEQGNIKSMPQPDLGELKLAPKIFKDFCKINWNKTPKQIHDFIRGLSPYPGAWAELTSPESVCNLKIYKTSYTNTEHNFECGTLHTDGKTYMSVACNGGYINVLELQAAGKKSMLINNFLAGFRDFKSYILK